MSFVFNRHPEIDGKHAFLSASKYHWIRYTPEKMAAAYDNFYAAEEGTKLHDFAAHCIRMGQRLPREKKTLNMYVNDAIKFGLKPEQPLYYSRNCFGTTDAIGFDNGILRIHDYKSGIVPAHEEQLFIYASLFCLEYGANPEEIQIFPRIYQSDEIHEFKAEQKVIRGIMNKIIEYDQLIEDKRKKEVTA